MHRAAHTAGRYARVWHRLRGDLATPRDAAVLLAFCLLTPIGRDLLGRRGPSVRVRLRGGPVMTVSDSSELIAMREVFTLREYEMPAGSQPRTILDCGANVGFASAYFARTFPGARIIAVEADPATFERLRRVADQLPNVEAVHCAVAGEDGSLKFHSAKRSMSSSIFSRGPGDRLVEVPAATLGTLLDRHGMDRVDLLKLDIEGAEFAALAAAGKTLQRVENLVAEVHFDLVDATEDDLRGYLDGFSVEMEPLPVVADRFLLRATRAASRSRVSPA